MDNEKEQKLQKMQEAVQRYKESAMRGLAQAKTALERAIKNCEISKDSSSNHLWTGRREYWEKRVKYLEQELFDLNQREKDDVELMLKEYEAIGALRKGVQASFDAIALIEKNAMARRAKL